MAQETPNNEEQKHKHIKELLDSDNISKLLDIIDTHLDKRYTFDTEKGKKVYRYYLVGRMAHYIVILSVVVILSFLLYCGKISDTIFATLVGSIVGYIVGNNSKSSQKG